MSAPAWRRAFRLDVGPTHVERQVEEELAFHLKTRIDARVAGGMPPDAAGECALRQFGDVTEVRAACVDIDRGQAALSLRATLLDDLQRDVRFAWRALRHNWIFTAVVVSMLAVGIGANSATFTLIDALLLRSLPVPHPETLVTIGDPRRTGSVSTGAPRTDLASYPVYEDIRDGNRVFSGLYATGRADRLDVLLPDASGSGGRGAEPEHPRGRFVSGNYFSVLQVPAQAGRTFGADEDRVPGRDPVVVISHGYWERRFGGERSVIGRTISINGVPLTIIGVAQAGFSGDLVGQQIDVWIPIMMRPVIMPYLQWVQDRSVNWLLLMGRLARGVSLAQARANITALDASSLREHTTGNDLSSVERQLQVNPLRVEPGARGFSHYRSVYASALLTVMGTVALVLLVVCANIANLFLARATARAREMSVRMALGAGRARLIRQLITESLMLSAIGATFGVALAMIGSRAMLRLVSDGTSLPLDTRVDARVVGFTIGLSILAAIGFGLVPALRATRVQLASSLRAGARSVMGGKVRPGRLGTGSPLVVAQVAVSMLLLAATGMLVRSTQRLERADVGVARDQLLIASIDAERSGYSGAQLAALTRDLTLRIGQLRGVSGVTTSENGLFGGTESGTTIRVPSFAVRADTDTLVAYDDVGPAYFHTVGAQMLRGRDIDARDSENGSKVMVINQTMAHFYFPRGDALGQHITSDSATWEIVGVVRDIEERGIRNPPSRRLYYPIFQMNPMPGYFRLEIRTSGDPGALVQPVQRALRQADPSLVVLDVEPLADLIRDSIAQDRLVAQVITFFGVLALVLAALGLYGVLAYATIRRTSEFGLRMALGALPRNVTGMVLRQAVTLVSIGMALGIPLILFAAQLLRERLFGITSLDPPSIASAIAALGAAAVLAAYLPARRAAHVPPLVAMRSD